MTQPSPNPTRSIFDLNVDELEEVLKQNILPAGVTLQGLEDRKDFDKLFKHRLSPKFIAQVILKEKMADQPRQPAQATAPHPQSQALREQRLELKKQELAIKKMKAETQSAVNQKILDKLAAIETGQTMLAGSLASVNQKLSLVLEALAIVAALSPEEESE
jgi:hypothetical protein